jgi:hypothetical protein
MELDEEEGNEQQADRRQEQGQVLAAHGRSYKRGREQSHEYREERIRDQPLIRLERLDRFVHLLARAKIEIGIVRTSRGIHECFLDLAVLQTAHRLSASSHVSIVVRLGPFPREDEDRQRRVRS